MKISSYKLLSVLLVISALATTVQSRDISVSVLTDDVLSYNVKDLIDNTIVGKNLKQGPQPPYTSNKAYAQVSNVREVGSELFPDTDLKVISRSFINSATTGFAISEDGLVSFTLDGNKITAGAKLHPVSQVDARSLFTNDAMSMVTTVDEKDVTVTMFDAPNFGGQDTEISWAMTNVVPDTNAQSLIWTDTVADPNVDYLLVYQPDNEYITTKVNGFVWWEIGAADPNSDELVLKTGTPDNFPVDTTAITHMTVIDNQLWVTYTSAAGTGTAYCTLSVTNSKINIKDAADCTVVTVEAPYDTASSIVITKEAEAVFAWLYMKDATNGPTLAYCDVNTTDNKFENCIASTQYVEVYGAEFDQLFYSTSAGVNVLFSVPDVALKFRRTTSLIYNVVKDTETIRFDVVEDRISSNIVGFGNSAYALREETYSAYSQVQGEEHVTIYASQVPGGVGSVDITDTQAQAVVSTISIDVKADSTGHYKLNVPLPNVKAFKEAQGNVVPTSRGYFAGNSLDFAIDGEDYNIFNTYTWPVAATADLGEGAIVVAGSVGGVVVNGENVQAFFCPGSIYNGSFKCALSGDAQTIGGLTAAIFAVEATPYDTSDNGIIALTANGADSQLHLFNSNNFYKAATMTGFVATPTNSNYQRVDTLYTVWTTDGTATITVYVFVDNNLTTGTNVVIDGTFFGKDLKDFCPTGIQSDPSNQEQTFITSQCANDETRIFTVKVVKTVDTNVLTVTPVSSKALNSPKLGDGVVNVCSLGGEHIIQITTGNKAISSTDNSSDGTFIGLDVEKNMGTDNVDMICIRGSQNFIIATDDSTTGDHTYAALFGNRSGNIANRYHSINKLDGDLAGYEVKYASWNLEGYTVALASGSNWRFQTVLVNGPKIVYTGPVTTETATVTLNVTALGEVAGTETFTLDVTKFNPVVEVKAEEAGSKPVEGAQTLDKLVKITGPIFNVELDKGTSEALISFTGAVVDDAAYVPKFDLDLIPPARIKADKDGNNIGFGPSTPFGGVNFYLYKDYTVLNHKFQINDQKLNSLNSIDCVNTSEVAFGVFGTVNGGINQLNWFIRELDETDPEKYNSGVIPGVEFFATEVQVLNVLLSKAVVLAIDSINNKALAFTIEPKKDAGEWNIEVTNKFTFNDCKF